MAISVPYNPVPEAPSRAPIPEVRPTVVEEAFGGGIARGISGLGREVENVGNQIFQRAIALQDLENQTQAEEANNRFVRESAQLHANFNSLEGINAGPKALEKYTSDLETLRSKIGEDLTNSAARRLYDRGTRGQLARHVFNGAGHAASQMKAANKQALVSSMDLDMQGFSSDPNPETFDQRFQDIRQKVLRLGANEGWTEPKLNDEILKMRSRARIEQIRGLAAEGRAFAAEELYNKHKDEIHWTQQDSIQNLVHNGTTNVKARTIDDIENGDIKSGYLDEKRTLEDRIKAARKRAEEESTDPALSDVASDRVRATYNRWKQDQKDKENNNIQIIQGAFPVAQSFDHLMSMPEVQEAYQNLPPTKRNALPGQFRRYQDSVNKETREQSNTYLRGLADEDLQKFLATDLTQFNLSRTDLDWLLALQRKKSQNPAKDPKTAAAMAIITPILPDSIRTDRDEMVRLRGAMQIALEEYIREYKSMPKAEDIRKLGARLLQEKAFVEPETWFSKSGWNLFIKNEPAYREKIPPDVLEAVKEDPGWAAKGITNVTDEMVRIEVQQQLWRKFYQNKRDKASE